MPSLRGFLSLPLRCSHVSYSAPLPFHGSRRVGRAFPCQTQSFSCFDWSPQRRYLHAAILAPGLGGALASLPGAGKDSKGHITVPVPDPRLERLAKLERTKPVPASVEVVEVEKDLVDELVRIVQEPSAAAATKQVEFSGKFLSSLRSSDAIVLAVPCRDDADLQGYTRDPVKWFQAAELALVSADLQNLEHQVCKDGNTGPSVDLDIAKLRKALSSAKDPTVRRDADSLVQEVLVPGFKALRERLRAGLAARGARAGLGGNAGAVGKPSGTLDPRFEDLARGWLNSVVTWKPLILLADVPEADAGDAVGATCAANTDGPAGNAASRDLLAFAKEQGLPCIILCAALEGEVAGLREEPEFLTEYLSSFGLMEGELTTEGSNEPASLRPWRSRSADLTRYVPRLFNLLTYYTAGEKEARAWMCPRVRKDGSPLAFVLFDSGKITAPAAVKPGKNASGKAGASGKSGTEEDGVPAPLAARAIHTSFESRLKNVELWRFEDLDALGTTDSGPGAKERARSTGKARKLPAQALLQEGDVVEFGLG